MSKKIFVVLALLVVSACSSAGGGGGADTDASSGDAVREEGRRGGSGADGNGLTLIVNDKSLLSGTLERGDRRLAFEVERGNGKYATTFRAADGSLLMRVSYDGRIEKLEIGGTTTLEGPTGSLFVATEPNWSVVRVSGDLSAVQAVLALPDFALTNQLSEALAARPDVDAEASVFPFGAAFASEADSAGSPPSSALPGAELLNHDPAGCAICHSLCAAGALACVAASWGFLAWACIPAGIACHAGCAASACQ
jgi:hypothetical protein